jgi:hypothetical protein
MQQCGLSAARLTDQEQVFTALRDKIGKAQGGLRTVGMFDLLNLYHGKP